MWGLGFYCACIGSQSPQSTQTLLLTAQRPTGPDRTIAQSLRVRCEWPNKVVSSCPEVFRGVGRLKRLQTPTTIGPCLPSR